MIPAPIDGPAARSGLRLWPGVVLLILQWLVRFGVPLVVPDTAMISVMGSAAGGLALLVWWLFFSRAPWVERVGVLLLVPIALVITKAIVHPSVAGGMMGMMVYIVSIPAWSLALVAAAAVARHWHPGPRRALLAGAIAAACGSFALLRTGGIGGEGGADYHWRWTPTPEERLLATGTDKPRSSAAAAIAAPAGEPEWPGFRGPRRDGTVRGTRISTGWAKTPPQPLWRRAVGPGWSSFAVHGDVFFTQEQLGVDEVVTCYRTATGEPVWRHRERVRFYESNAGAGPRATPTLHGDRVYAFGATGVLTALGARDGKVAWTRDVAAERHTSVPAWGFASSPLVVDELVIVAVPGKLAAYDRKSGQPRWFGAPHGGSYSSPHAATIGGVQQVLLLSTGGATAVAPASGKVLWQHAWTSDGIVQPAFTAEGDLLIGSGSGMGGGVGTRRLEIKAGRDGWAVDERWTSRGLKPYYNDLVVHQGCAFGFDGTNLACIELQEGERKWKGGRYGNGQVIALADQDLLLVLSEKGEVALVRASPQEFQELGRFAAITGKTWNHPVLVGQTLLVRNAEEMAAYRLP